jgi:hypothetical protein
MSSSGEARRPVITLGSADSQHMSIRPTRGNDDGWSHTTVDMRIGGFVGHVEGNLRIEDLPRLRTGLQNLYERLEGEVVFETMEGWIKIRFKGDGHGHIDIDAELRDEPQPGVQNTLRFTMPSIDQTYLPGLLRAIDEALVACTV